MGQRRHVGTLGDPRPRLDRGRGNEPTKGRDPEVAVEVGLVHSRGKAGVMAGEPEQGARRDQRGCVEEQGDSSHTRDGALLKTKLDLITERAKREPKCRFTTLAHLLDEPFLAESHQMLNRRRAPGVDGTSVEEYGRNLKENLTGLVARMKAKRYRPQPVRRVYIPKGPNKVRPLGIPTAEDRVVQMGVARILTSIFEGDFLNLSYGFRPKRGCHDALRAFDTMVVTQKVNYVIEVDIKGYYDHISHAWLIKCLKQRIADPSFLSLMVRMLKAGVMEEGQWMETAEGAPQGGVASPVLSNIYLHYILDLWVERKLKKALKGYVELIRYADDFVIGCQYQWEAEKVLAELKERLKKFGLEVSEEKTRIVGFGRFTREVGTVGFLGFTHFCARSRKGRFVVGRRTDGKRLRAALKAMNIWLRTVRNKEPLPVWWAWLRKRMEGHYQYYGITGNGRSIGEYHNVVTRMAYKWWNRRSQRRSGRWKAFQRRLSWNPLPRPRIVRDFALARSREHHRRAVYGKPVSTVL